MAERVGEVTDITAPNAGKKSGSCKVGGRKVWFYWTEYQSDEPSSIRTFLEDAQRNGVRVEVSGDERPGQTAKGDTYLTFTARDVRAASQNGSQTPPDGSGAPRFVGRDPGTADFFTATRWAYSLAADMVARQEGVSLKVADLTPIADELFQTAWAYSLRAKELTENPEASPGE